MLNLPNILTILRIILGIIVPIIMIMDDFWLRVWACILFAIAAFTDWFDGWYARKYNLVTKLGKILDPIADKIIVLGSFAALSSLTAINCYPFWWLLPIFIREIGITIYRLLFLLREQPVVVAATKSGKLKTTVQMLSLPVAYFYYMFKTYPKDNPIGEFVALEYMMYTMILISTLFVFYSGFSFFRKNWKNI